MAHTFSTFLMFDGVAEEAMRFYVSVFEGAETGTIERYGPGEGPGEGKLKLGAFTLGGQRFTCFNSPVKHAFGFTPAISVFVECESEAELDRTFAALSQNGQTLMPLGRYDFSTKFGWCNDRFGVSWQLNLR